MKIKGQIFFSFQLNKWKFFFSVFFSFQLNEWKENDIFFSVQMNTKKLYIFPSDFCFLMKIIF
jgi:hypothetical protein